MSSKTTRWIRSTGSGRREFLAAAAAVVAGGAVASEAPKPEVGLTRKPPAERPFQLGLASYTLRKFSLDQALAMTRRVDLRYICLKSFHLPLEAKPEEIAAAAAKVKAAGIALYGCGVVSMNKAADVDQAFNHAKAAGMKTIVAAPKPDLLPLIERRVREFDLQVAIHNHGPGDKLYPTPQSIYEKVRDLDKRIGICIDIGHTVRIGADPVDSTKRYAERILDVHIKDVSAASAKGQTVEVGRGVIDIPAFLRALIEINYRGIVSFEHEKDENDPLAGLAESVGYVRGVLAVL